MLVENDPIISEAIEVAQSFNNFFGNTVNTLEIVEHKHLINNCKQTTTHNVDIAIEMYAAHPSIISIRENVKIEGEFSFSIITANDIKNEISNLKPKAGTFMDIPTKQLKQMCDIVCKPLMMIWNEEILGGKKLPNKLKLFHPLIANFVAQFYFLDENV